MNQLRGMHENNILQIVVIHAHDLVSIAHQRHRALIPVHVIGGTSKLTRRQVHPMRVVHKYR
jgi:hypothetical protein